ncbi:helix-turn-helix domain-containing protein [Streptomyces scopuliridis]|uniref:helix-turn-helix domain-containing protein n=1 Tax=Streptomyces scopuliridis TaxID=452529 RepID=UPI0036C08164
MSIRTIAAELGRGPSTISREVSRNRAVHPRGEWSYRPHAPQRRADKRPATRTSAPRGPRPARSDRTPSCDTSSRTTCPCAGAQSRSATLRTDGSPTGRRCTWSTRRSTRPSTSRAAAS